MRDEKIITEIVNKLIPNRYKLGCYCEGKMLFVKKTGKEERSIHFGDLGIVFLTVSSNKYSVIDQLLIEYENVSLESLGSAPMFVANFKTGERWSIAVGRKSHYGDTYTKKQGA